MRQMIRSGEMPQKQISAADFRARYTKGGVDYAREFALFVQLMFELFQKEGRPISVLEIGCGDGRVGGFLAELPFVSTYLGIDTNPSNLGVFRAKHPNVEVKQESFFSLDPTLKFDFICAPYMLLPLFTFLRQEVFLLKAIQHCLTKRSMVALDTLVPFGFKGNQKHSYSDEGLPAPYPRREYYPSLATLQKWISSTEKRLRTITYPFAFEMLDEENLAVHEHHMLVIQ